MGRSGVERILSPPCSLPRFHFGERILGGLKFRVQTEDCLQLGPRFVQAAGLQATGSDVEVCFPVIRVNADGLSKMEEGIVRVPGSLQSSSEIILGGGVVGLDLDGGFKVLNRFLDLAVAHQKIAQVVMRLDVIREKS